MILSFCYFFVPIRHLLCPISFYQFKFLFFYVLFYDFVLSFCSINNSKRYHLYLIIIFFIFFSSLWQWSFYFWIPSFRSPFCTSYLWLLMPGPQNCQVQQCYTLVRVNRSTSRKQRKLWNISHWWDSISHHPLIIIHYSEMRKNRSHFRWVLYYNFLKFILDNK